MADVRQNIDPVSEKWREQKFSRQLKYKNITDNWRGSSGVQHLEDLAKGMNQTDPGNFIPVFVSQLWTFSKICITWSR